MLAAGAMKSVELMEENPKMFSDLRCVGAITRAWQNGLRERTVGGTVLLARERNPQK